MGAAGAFVHALEDEYSEVRFHALDSIRSLSARSESFSKTSIEFLVGRCILQWQEAFNCFRHDER